MSKRAIAHVQRRAVRQTEESPGFSLGNGTSVTGLMPLVVVDMKAGSGRHVRNAAFWMGKLGLGCRLVQTIGNVETYEVHGAGEALERFLDIGTTWGFVKDWSMPVTARVGWQGQGSGPAKDARHRRLMPWHAQAVKREDERAERACAVRKAGHDDSCRRQHLFGHQ